MSLTKVVLLCILVISCSFTTSAVIQSNSIKNVNQNGLQHFVDIVLENDDFKNCFKSKNKSESNHIRVINIVTSNLCEEAFLLWTNVESLFLNEISINKLESDTFKGMTSLKNLQLRNNNLKTIKERIFNLLSLELLDLSGNSIVHISISAFDNMPNLVSVNFSFNRIKRLRKNWFKHSVSLKQLDFSFNNLTLLQKKAFKHIVPSDDLFINLSNNQIGELEEKTFMNFEEKGKVDLCNNNLTVLPPNIFGYTRLGQFELILNNNQFVCFDQQIFNKVVMNCKSLYLLDNPLSCDCVRRMERFNNKRGNNLLVFDFNNC